MLLGRYGNDAVQTVSAEGLPLGVVHNATFDECTVTLPFGARLMLYTDGVTESRNRAGESFGEQRLKDWLGSTCSNLQSADSLKAALISTLNQFASLPASAESAPHGKRPLSNGRNDRQRGRIAMKAQAALKRANDSLYDDRTFLIAVEEETVPDRGSPDPQQAAAAGQQVSGPRPVSD